MKKDDMYNGSNSATPNNKKSSVSSNRTSSFRMIDIDVKKAKKDVDTIFSYTSKRLDENSKKFRKNSKDIFEETSRQAEEFFDNIEDRIDNIFKNIDKQYDKFEKDMSKATDKSAKNMENQYAKAFNDIDKAHKESVDKRKKQEEIINEALKETISQYEKIGNKTLKIERDKSTGEIVNAGNLSNTEKIANTIFNVKNADSFGGKIAVGIIDAFAKGGKLFIDIWMNRFEQGMQRIVSTYEETYHNVSTLTDTTQKTYKTFQNDVISYLKDNDLNDNIRLSEVMKEMSDAVMSGITDQGKAQNVALQNSITKAINPFLNTQTDAYQDMQLALGRKFVESSAGIIDAVKENVGQTRFVSKNLNDMLSQFEPVIMNAKSDQFDKQFADMSAKLEAAVASGQMTSGQAEDLKQSLYNVTMDQYNTLQNGKVSEIDTISKMMQQGIDPSQNLSKTLEELVKSNTNIMSQVDTTGATGTLNRNIMAGEGMTSSGAEWWKDGDKILKAVTEANVESSKDNYKNLIDKLASGDTQTALYKKDTKAENASKSFAQFQQTYPDAYKILKAMLATLGTIAGSIVGSTLLDKGLDIFGPKINKGLSNVASKVASKVPKGIKDALGNTKAMGQMFKQDVAKDGIKNTAKTYAKTFGPELLGTLKTGLTKGGITAGGSASTVAKVAGGTGIAAGALMTIADGVKGFKKTEEWFGKNADLGDKVASTIGGALGGTGKGIGQKGATVGGVIKNTGSNALKGAAIGAGIGSFIPVVGTAIGGAVGAGVGAITGLIGGERISKAAKSVGNTLVKGVKTSLELNPITNVLGKQFKSVTKNFKQTTGEIGDIWNDSNKNLAEKIGGTFGTIKQGIKNTGKELFESIGKGVEDSIVGKGLKSIKKFGSSVSKQFKKFKTDPAKYIGEGLDKTKDKVTDFAKGVGDKIESAFDGAKKFFKDIGKSSKEAESKAKKADAKEDKKSSGSHASGLNTVPYDGYLAKLHKGETIFNATASKQISKMMDIVGTSTNTNAVNNSIGNIIGRLFGSINKDLEDKKKSASRLQLDQFKSISNRLKESIGIKNSDKEDKMKSLVESNQKILSDADTKQAKPIYNSSENLRKSIFNKENKNSNMLDTSSLENAIYAIGDRIVRAIETNGVKRSSREDIVDRNSGTVKVRFDNSNENEFGSLASTLLG